VWRHDEACEQRSSDGPWIRSAAGGLFAAWHDGLGDGASDQLSRRGAAAAGEHTEPASACGVVDDVVHAGRALALGQASALKTYLVALPKAVWPTWVRER
jgi:hypothetical protein